MLTRGTLIRLCNARDLLREIPDRPVSVHDIARKEKGVQFTQQPTDAGPVRIAICADTCGNLVQLYQRSR